MRSFCIHRESNPVLFDNLEGWDGTEGGGEVQEGGAMCIFMADLRGFMAEANGTLQSNYPPIKNKSVVRVPVWYWILYSVPSSDLVVH